MERKFKRNLLTSSSISLLLLIISSAASFLSIKSLLESNWWVGHTNEVIYNLNAGRAELINAQTSMRGYLITGKENFLQQYIDVEGRSNFYFDKVRSLTSDNPRQQNAAAVLEPQVKQFIEFLAVRVKEKTNGRSVSAGDLDRGTNLMNSISSIIKNMVDEEQRLLVIRTAASKKYSSYSLILIVAAAVISLIITIIFFIKLLRDNHKRMELHKELLQNEKDTANRISVISSIASEISNGNYHVRVDDIHSDSLGALSGSLNHMAESLSTAFGLLSDREWHQSGLAELNNVMIGDKKLSALSKDIITFLASYTESCTAAFYMLDGDELVYTAGYNCITAEKKQRISLGLGLTGQAAVSGRLLELKDIPPGGIKVSYALGEAKPRHVIALPISDGKLTGVAEIASLKNYTPRDIELFTAVSHNIAVAVAAARNGEKVQDLLEETQSQSEELRAQHAELEALNEELEAQTEKLQASEEELRIQQEELQQINNELSQKGRQLEEKNTQVQKKSEEIERSTKYKSEFLANMSHELRTPLNSILLLSRLLSENNNGSMTSEQTEFAAVIQSSGKGLLELIDEILDLSKIEAGKMVLDISETPVKEIAETMKNLFSEMAREKNIVFEIDSSSAPEIITTDRLRLEQILKNFISNAVKFTSEGSVRLEITTHSAPERTVKFAVKDTGIGIPLEKQDLIFEAFQQADGSTKRKYGGTGLGLSISRELAQLLQGEISLISQSGHGSEFALTIPCDGFQKAPGLINQMENASKLSDTEASAETIKESAGSYLINAIPDEIPDDREVIALHEKIILIVEDDISFAKSLMDFTRTKGYKAIVCVRGDQAAAMAVQYKPSGILLDVELPLKNGWDVMTELKADPSTQHIPVHMMSAHKLSYQSRLRGAVHFLEKPLAFEELPEVFKRIERIICRESHMVLILEDNRQHAEALRIFLQTYHITAAVKSDPAQSIEALDQQQADCIILDMGIPHQQAYTILEKIKKNSALENLPVIIFTGHSIAAEEEARIKKYADSIVIKTADSYQRLLDEISIFLHLTASHKKINSSGGKKLLEAGNVLANKTVLVVDDDVRNIYSITRSLESYQMNVIAAIDGSEALKALEELPSIDIVLLDMMMPGMDGYETARRIREDKKLQELPVIAVTAKAMTGDREKCIAAGASDYMTKPVDTDQLILLLRAWLYPNM